METAIVIVAIVLVVAGRLMWSSYLSTREREMMHRERMAAIEKGADVPAWPDELLKPGAAQSALLTLYRERAAAKDARYYLLRGLVWFFLGITLATALYAISISTRREVVPQWYYSLPVETRGPVPPRTQESEMAPGFAALGLIPAGVGLAYLLFYRAESRKPRHEL